MIYELSDIRNQIEDLRSQYPGLSCSDIDPDMFFIHGMLDFKATYNEITIEDVFDMVITGDIINVHVKAI